jgi:hypothetical protein
MKKIQRDFNKWSWMYVTKNDCMLKIGKIDKNVRKKKNK